MLCHGYFILTFLTDFKQCKFAKTVLKVIFSYFI